MVGDIDTGEERVYDSLLSPDHMTKKTPSWVSNAYKTTQVPWARTQAHMYKILGELGIYEIRFTNLKDRFALEFVIRLDNEEKPRGVRITVPIKHIEDEEMRNRELNIVHRVLFNHLKAKFVAIGTGLSEFEEEFMAHLIVTNKDGTSSTMAELVLPQYKEAIDSGKAQVFQKT